MDRQVLSALGILRPLPAGLRNYLAERSLCTCAFPVGISSKQA
jgi:hypothetical protein